MDKKISLKQTLYEVAEKFPELIDPLYEIGFLGIKNPLLRNTHGRIMTLKDGLKKLSIEFSTLEETLNRYGFEVELEAESEGKK